MTQDVTDAVDRRDLRRLAGKNQDDGELAEAIAREAYDLEPVPGDDELDGDLRNPRTEARYEVKSTHARVGDEYPADGRFRLWRDQHRSIVGYDAQPDLAGWYVFVRFVDDTPRELRRVEPSTVTRLVGGEWGPSGHAGREAEQYKLPVGEVFDS